MTSNRCRNVKKPGTSRRCWCCYCCCCPRRSKSMCLISISSTWYAAVIVLLHVYLVRNRVGQIMTLASPPSTYLSQAADMTNRSASLSSHGGKLSELFDVLRNEVDGQTEERRHTELITRLVTLACSLLFIIIFLVCSLQKCANYANDSVKFGRDFFAEQLHHHRKHISRVWKYLEPVLS